MAVALHAAADDLALQDVEGGEQGGDAVALVIVRHGPGPSLLQGKAGLSAVQGLDLRFLVDAEHHCVGGRTNIEADDIADLGGELRVAGQLEGAYSGYGDSTVLHSADALIVHRSQDPRVLIIEYEVHGEKISTGNSYDNRFISVVTIEDRKFVHWRDYMDSLAAFTAETGTRA